MQRNEKVIELLREFIEENPSLVTGYEFIGIYGSILEKADFRDIDFATLGNDDNHSEFMNSLKGWLEGKGYKVDVFKLARDEPEKEGDSHLLIHDLHIPPRIEDNKLGWMDTANEIKRSSKTLYGSREAVPSFDMTVDDFYEFWYEWIRNVETEEDFENFTYYMRKIVPKLTELYPDLDLDKMGDEIKTVIDAEDWEDAKNKIERIIEGELQ